MSAATKPGNTNILIRADSGPRTGTGHVMRMFALAQAWQQTGGDVTFVCGVLPGTLQQRISDAGFRVAQISEPCGLNATHGAGKTPDAQQTIELATRYAADWVVADGYIFDDTWQKVIAESGFKLLAIDDFVHASHKHANIVVNQNIYAARDQYPETSADEVLVGGRYLLMRSEFTPRELPAARKIAANVERMLITFGGEDSDNNTLSVLRVLQDILPAGFHVDAVLGAGFANRRELDNFLEHCPLDVTTHFDATNMCELMTNADLAISAGGSTCYELARCGVPAIVVTVADNQLAVAKALAAARIVIYAGDQSIITERLFSAQIRNIMNDHTERTKMALAGQALVDGRGAGRIAEKMMSTLFELRAATMADSETILAWRNEPETRAVSFCTNPIVSAEHHEWIRARLGDAACRIWIAVDKDGTAIGQVRVQKADDNETAYISIGLQSGFRGRGLGPLLIDRASKAAFEEFEIKQVVAQIKPFNTASRTAFTKAGYVSIPPTVINGQAAIQMAWQPEQAAATKPNPLKRSA